MPATSERRGSVLRRRLITIPAVLGMALAAVALSPIWVPLLTVIDLVRRRRMASLRMGVFATAYLLCETAGLVVAFALWLRQAVLPESRESYLARNFRLQCWWGSTIFAAAQRVYDLELQVESDDDLSTGPLLLLLRHSSLGDTLLGLLLFSKPHGICFRYVLKRELLFDPCLDIVGHRLPNAFVRRDGTDTPGEIRSVAALAEELGPKDGVLIYPEGTRFTEEKRRRLIERARERGDTLLRRRAESLQRVLPPRPGGPLALLEAAPDVDVVLCMHTGFEAAGSAGDLWSGRLVGSRIRVRLERIPARTIPKDATDWLQERWEEVDAFVTQHQDAA